MKNESRVKKTLLNAKVNMICYFASFITAFFTRKILLDQLGAEFIGFTGTIGSLLSFLNMAELGVGTAIGYVLYKPIADNDRDKITEIVSLLGYIYRKIGLTILGLGFVVSLFLPQIFPHTSFNWCVIYFGFYAYLTSSMLGYFVNYRATLLTADQRNYIVTGYFQAATTIKTIIQMFLALYFKSYILYLTIEILYGVVNSIILNSKINKEYPWLKSKVSMGQKALGKYPEIIKYTKQIFVHRLGGVIQSQLPPVLIYSFVSLPIVALYTNYTLLTQKVESLLSATINSTSAAVGNLIAEGNKEKILKVFKELLAIRMFIASISAACIYEFSSSLISVWLGDEYVLGNSTVALIAILNGLSITRGVLDQFCYGYGLFADVWAPYAESAIMVLFAITGGYLFGLPGVLCGPLASLVAIIYIWKPYYLFYKGFNIGVMRYWIIFLMHITVAILAFMTISYINSSFIEPIIKFDGWEGLIIKGALYTITISILLFIGFYITSEGFRDIVSRTKFLKRH